jgi:hypothetical protein
MTTWMAQMKAEYEIKLQQSLEQRDRSQSQLMEENKRINEEKSQLEIELEQKDKVYNDKLLMNIMDVREKFEEQVEAALEKRLKRETERLERFFQARLEEKVESTRLEMQKQHIDDPDHSEMESLQGQVLKQGEKIRELEKLNIALQEQNKTLMVDKVELKHMLDAIEKSKDNVEALKESLRIQMQAEMRELLNEKESNIHDLHSAMARLREDHSNAIHTLTVEHELKIEQLRDTYMQGQLAKLQQIADATKKFKNTTKK